MMRSTALAVLIFAGVPAAIVFLKMPLVGFIALWGLTLYWVSRHPVRLSWPKWQNTRVILARAAAGAVFLTLGLWALEPERLLAFPLAMPWRYALVMLIYPILSVFPQEIVFRPVFWHLFPGLSRWSRILWNALAFAAAHSIFLNPAAVVLSFIGGVFLAHTYERHRHFGLVFLEHTLYGWLVFTIGWGVYFYHGTVGG
jgi:hypothetical protein